MNMKRSLGDIIFDTINNLIMVIIICIMLYPFINQVAISFSSNTAVISGKVNLVPIDFQVKAYRDVITDRRFKTSFINTVLFTVAATFMHVLMTALFSYPLSKRKLKGRNAVMTLLIFSMMFGTGGLIPNYLLIKNLGLVNTYWALWLPALINIWQVIIVRNFYQQLPESLEESASLDGARQLTIFFRIILPLSMPVIACISLFQAVSAWNTFFGALIYINDPKKRLLQQHLNDILQAFIVPAQGPDVSQSEQNNSVSQETLKAATLMCTTLPIVFIYPFLQKYFVKGVMVGSIKG